MFDVHYMAASPLKFYDLTVGVFPINSRHTKLQFALRDLLNKSGEKKMLENYPGSGMEGEISAAEVSNVNLCELGSDTWSV